MYENDLCNRCGMPGHIQRDCSLLWRRYVFCREPMRSEVARASSLMAPHCYTCASATHFGDECPSRRKSEWSVFHRPILEFLQLAALPSVGSAAHSASARPLKAKFDVLAARERRFGSGRSEDLRVNHVYRRGDDSRPGSQSGHGHRRESDSNSKYRSEPAYGSRKDTGDKNWRSRGERDCVKSTVRREERSHDRSTRGPALQDPDVHRNSSPRNSTGPSECDVSEPHRTHYNRSKSHYTGSYRSNC